MKTKKQYIAPALTAVEFKTERGYAVSGFFTIFLWESQPETGYNAQGQENWEPESEGGLFDRWGE